MEGDTTSGHQSSQACIDVASKEATNFREWLEYNHGKTTLEDQLRLATRLYDDVMGPEQNPPTVTQRINSLQKTPIVNDHLVSWDGIYLDWFLNVLCESPYFLRLREFGCEMWFVRKVCVIEMIRRNQGGNQQHDNNNNNNNPILSGPFATHVEQLQRAWKESSNVNKEYDLTQQQQSPTIISKATTFVSYTGKYELDWVIKILKHLNGSEYIWFDVFCVDQFAWTGRSRSEEMKSFKQSFMSQLQDQIKNIQNTALILDQWVDAMQTLGQIWVLWEMYNTAKAEATLKVLLPKDQVLLIEDRLQNGEADSFKTSLASINAMNAKANDDVDRRLILERMGEEGLQAINELVIGKLRAWLIDMALTHLQRMRREASASDTFLNNLGVFLQAQGQKAEAEMLFREALELMHAQFVPQDLTVMQVQNNLVGALKEQGKLEEAEGIQRKILHVLNEKEKHVAREVFEINQSNLERCQKVVQIGLVKRGKPLLTWEQLSKLSQEQLEELSRYAESMETKYHMIVCQSWDNLGSILSAQGNIEEAEVVYGEALERARKHLGEEHHGTCTVLNNMAMLFIDECKFLEAEQLLQELLDHRRKHFGDQHPTTLISICNLACVKRNRGNWKDAENLYRDALTGCRAQLGEHHKQTYSVMGNLAHSLRCQGKLEEAERMGRKLLSMSREHFGDPHDMTLTSMNNLASILQYQGNFQEAEELIRKVLLVRMKMWGEEHHGTLTALNNLATLFQKQGKFDEAEEIHRKVFKIELSNRGSQHPETLNSMHNLAAALGSQGKLDEADEIYRELVEKLKENLGHEHPDTVETIRMWKMLLRRKEGNLDEVK